MAAARPRVIGVPAHSRQDSLQELVVIIGTKVHWVRGRLNKETV